MKTNYKIRFKNFVPIVTIFLVALFYCRNLFYSGLPNGTDQLIWVTWLKLVIKNNSWFQTWRPFYDYGETTLFYNLQLNPYLFILSKIFPPINVIKISIFILIIITGLSSYYFNRRFFKKLSATIGSIIYMSTQLFFSQITEGHLYNLFGYAFFPVIILVFIKMVEDDNKGRNIIYFSLITTLYLLCSQPYNIYMIFIYLSLFFIILIFYNLYYKNYITAKKIILNSLLSIPIIIMLTSFIIIPYLNGVNQTFVPPGREFSIALTESKGFLETVLGRVTETAYLSFGHQKDFSYKGLFYIGLIIPFK
jgi:hypothetical protein